MTVPENEPERTDASTAPKRDKRNQLIPIPESWKRYVPGLELAILDVSRMDDANRVGHPIL